MASASNTLSTRACCSPAARSAMHSMAACSGSWPRCRTLTDAGTSCVMSAALAALMGSPWDLHTDRTRGWGVDRQFHGLGVNICQVTRSCARQPQAHMKAALARCFESTAVVIAVGVQEHGTAAHSVWATRTGLASTAQATRLVFHGTCPRQAWLPNRQVTSDNWPRNLHALPVPALNTPVQLHLSPADGFQLVHGCASCCSSTSRPCCGHHRPHTVPQAAAMLPLEP